MIRTRAGLDQRRGGDREEPRPELRQDVDQDVERRAAVREVVEEVGTVMKLSRSHSLCRCRAASALSRSRRPIHLSRTSRSAGSRRGVAHGGEELLRGLGEAPGRGPRRAAGRPDRARGSGRQRSSAPCGSRNQLAGCRPRWRRIRATCAGGVHRHQDREVVAGAIGDRSGRRSRSRAKTISRVERSCSGPRASSSSFSATDGGARRGRPRRRRTGEATSTPRAGHRARTRRTVAAEELRDHLDPLLDGVGLAGDLVGQRQRHGALGAGRRERRVEGGGRGAEVRIDAVADAEDGEADSPASASGRQARQPAQQRLAVGRHLAVAVGRGDEEDEGRLRRGSRRTASSIGSTFGARLPRSRPPCGRRPPRCRSRRRRGSRAAGRAATARPPRSGARVPSATTQRSAA